MIFELSPTESSSVFLLRRNRGHGFDGFQTDSDFWTRMLGQNGIARIVGAGLEWERPQRLRSDGRTRKETCRG